MRLDLVLCSRSLTSSRTEAQRLIKEGKVLVDNVIVTKPAFDATEQMQIRIVGDLCPYVSRGGLKLAAALDAFGISPNGLICIDVGASTGGFTDCLLQNGATYVYAVENGHGQLHPKLLDDSRVVSIEHYNARNLVKDDFAKPIAFAVLDVSFISQTLILPSLVSVLDKGATIITLIKPQFEVGKAMLSKGGIVKNPKARKAACEQVISFAESLGLVCKGVIQSPILGGDGNEEFLAAFTVV